MQEQRLVVVKERMIKMKPEELARKYGDEEVLVVNKEDFDSIEDGLTHKGDKDVLTKLLNESFFVYRKFAEYNPKYLQLIPYVLIQHEDSFFTVKRINGDERLVGLISVGMGGHINPIDEDDDEKVLTNNIERELKEELFIDLSKNISCTYEGLLRYTDPNDVVSQDHVGVFYLLKTTDGNVRVKETDKMKGQFLPKEEFSSLLERSESWSNILIREYIL